MIKRCSECGHFMGISIKKKDISYICSGCAIKTIDKLNETISGLHMTTIQLNKTIDEFNKVVSSPNEIISALEQQIADLQRDIQTSFSARFITSNRVW